MKYYSVLFSLLIIVTGCDITEPNPNGTEVTDHACIYNGGANNTVLMSEDNNTNLVFCNDGTVRWYRNF